MSKELKVEYKDIKLSFEVNAIELHTDNYRIYAKKLNRVWEHIEDVQDLEKAQNKAKNLKEYDRYMIIENKNNGDFPIDIGDVEK